MKIERNIPIPPKTNKYDFVMDMHIGDSVKVATRNIGMGIIQRAKTLKMYHMRFSIRKQKVGFRIWRIE